MIAPRLTGQAIIETAELLALSEVVAGDWRLWHLADEAACRQRVAQGTDAYFVTWPDCSLGFVEIPEATQHFRGAYLIIAYLQARRHLESLMQYLLLETVDVSDQSRAH